MKRLGICVVAMGLLPFGAVAQQDDVARDLKKLEGTWRVIKVDSDPKQKPVPLEELAKVQVVFKGDKMTLQFHDKLVIEGTFILDPAKKPPTLDIYSKLGKDKGFEAYGLYQFNGDTLMLCLKDAGSTRPTEFKGGFRMNVYHLKRVNP